MTKGFTIVGGHVSADEDYETAFIRQTQEELNIDITKVHYKRVARLTPRENRTSAFMWVYILYSDIAPTYNENDFVEYYWLTPDELLERLDGHDIGKSDLLPIIKEIKDKL